MKPLISIFFSTFFVLLPLCLFAEEKEVTLEEVVVTATRYTEEIRKIPGNVTVITKKEIEESTAQNVVDLLTDQVDVVVRDFYGNGKSASVDVRGFGETGISNVLVLVDGRRVNNVDLSGVDWTQIPKDQVERIEIVRGSGSVLYGDNATGGVINIITKSPEKTFSANAEAVGGSYGFNRESASVSGKWGPLSGILNASHNSTEGYRENGFLRAEDVGGKLIYDLNDAISFNLSGSFHHDDQGLPGGLPKAIYDVYRRGTLAPDDHAKTDDWYLALGTKAKFGDWGRFEMNLSYRSREVNDFFIASFFEDNRSLTTWAVTPRYILEKPIWIFPNKLIFGLDFYSSDSTVFSTSSFPGFPLSLSRAEVRKNSTGLYGLDEFSILQNLILSLGFRWEWATYDFLQDVPRLRDKTHENEPAFNVDLTYLFDKKSSVWIGVRRSFRFPVTDELIQFFPTFEVNPNIEPQVSYQYEAGVRHAFTDWIEANLTLFWIETHNEIFFNPVTFANENFPKTRRQGIEVGARAKPFQWLSLWANYSYINPTLQQQPYSGNTIPGVPRNKGSFGANVLIWNNLSFNAATTFVGSSYLISDWANQVTKNPTYYTIDLKLSYAWKGLKAFVGVNNLTNQKYAQWAVTNGTGTSQFYYASPTRNFIGGVSYTF
jgi:iron complex outermembrane receptor protein